MKFYLFLLSLILLLPYGFAQGECLGPKSPNSIIENLATSGLSSSCLITKEKYNCKEAEADLSAEEKYKVIQCDENSIRKNSLGETSLVDCVWNGIKISANSLIDLKELPGAIAGGIAKGFKETQICNASIDKKRELLKAFNLSIQDNRYKLTENFLGNWLNDASCAEVEKLLSSRYQNYQTQIYRDRVNAITAGKKVAPLQTSQSDGAADIVNLLKEAMKGANVMYECYTPKVKAEMICAGVTSLLVDVATGMGIKGAITKISAVVKSKKALSNIRVATAAGDKVNLTDAGKLTASDRLKAAQEILGAKRPLSEIERQAILEAHEIGLAEGRGFFTYTTEDLVKKNRLLKKAGFSKEERELLIRNGITGQFTTEEGKKAYADTIMKTMRGSTTKEREAVINKFNKYLEDYKKADEPAIKANYARILGELSQANDPKTARAFYQMGLEKVKTIAEKDRAFFGRTKTLDHYLDLAAHAGDQAAVQKGMSEYVKQQFILDGKRYGWKSAPEAASELFNRLEDEAMHAKGLREKGVLKLEAARRKQKALLDEFKYIDQNGTRARSVNADFAQFPKSE